MSRSDSDIRRRELGIIIKRDSTQVEPIDDYHDKVPVGGCQYYGNTDLMMLWCSCCKEKECY